LRILAEIGMLREAPPPWFAVAATICENRHMARRAVLYAGAGPDRVNRGASAVRRAGLKEVLRRSRTDPIGHVETGEGRER
jgi:hypothetical protein